MCVNLAGAKSQDREQKAHRCSMNNVNEEEELEEEAIRFHLAEVWMK